MEPLKRWKSLLVMSPKFKAARTSSTRAVLADVGVGVNRMAD